MNKESGTTWKLGMFIIIGIVLFVVTIYFIGKQKNLFGSTFNLQSKFKTVSGLKVGNNVRFSGINIGTVDDIELVTDSSVIVRLVIKDEIRQFIKSDAYASIGSDGLMGDKVLSISPGTNSQNTVKNNDMIKSKEAIEMDDLMSGVKKTLDNAGIITAQLAEFTITMNDGKGTLSKLMKDQAFANSIQKSIFSLETTTNQFAKFSTSMNNGKGVLSKVVSDEKLGLKLDSTLSNLEAGTVKLNEVLEAAKHNFLLKGYFNKKKKEEDKKEKESSEKQEQLEIENELKKGTDSIK